MTPERWTAVDRYAEDILLRRDAVLEAAVAASEAAGLPPIAVSPLQGKFLELLLRMKGARRILEVGTLGGYSTIWLARALPEHGRIVTLELNEKHAQVARANFERAGLSDRIELRVGAALTSLAELEDEKVEPFDLVFIDADKPNLAAYFDRALRLTNPGAAIVCDNVVRKGAVIDATSEDESVQGVRRLNEVIASETACGRVSATTIQTVGSKGYDGFTLAWVQSGAGK